MMLAALLIAAWLAPAPAVEHWADVVEINHVYSGETGKEVFTQLLVRNWQPDAKGENWSNYVSQWRMEKDDRTFKPSAGVLLFDDNGTLRKIRYGTAIETWTGFDGELNERDVLPPAERMRRWKW